SGYEMIFLVATVLSIASLLIVRKLKVEEAPTTQGEPAEPVMKKAGKIFLELVRERTFWAFVLFVSLLVLVRAVFTHAHSTWPTYMIRDFGRDTPQAAIWSLNPLLIIVLTPIVGSLTSRFSAWWVIIGGSFVTASSLLFMVAHEPYEAAARAVLGGVLGPDAAYEQTGAYLFVIVLSVGESLWSPRLYEYVAMMAPKNREASYMGLAELPLFAAKIPVGLMSGVLIGTYCAENTPCQSEPIWLIVFGTTLAGPIIALAFSRFIRAAERARLAEGRAS
ncbi:MAG: MFS transporter, partial [Myxococcales bacterium]|nr:MFS transporter [Myxococcales bacterium]